jgi:16S rRNA (cytosine967-C5)-methyltransferase
LRANFARVRLDAEFVLADAAVWRPAVPFDAVLLDAPCSATGTIRRHPDMPYLKGPRSVASLARQQDQLLDAACAMLRPGGKLIYAVCSLQPEEGPQRVARALDRLGLARDPVRRDELPGMAEALTPEGEVRTTPALWGERGGMDGFFVARMIRSSLSNA